MNECMNQWSNDFILSVNSALSTCWWLQNLWFKIPASCRLSLERQIYLPNFLCLCDWEGLKFNMPQTELINPFNPNLPFLFCSFLLRMNVPSTQLFKPETRESCSIRSSLLPSTSNQSLNPVDSVPLTPSPSCAAPLTPYYPQVYPFLPELLPDYLPYHRSCLPPAYAPPCHQGNLSAQRRNII